jgi:hypothetical protein
VAHLLRDRSSPDDDCPILSLLEPGAGGDVCAVRDEGGERRRGERRGEVEDERERRGEEDEPLREAEDRVVRRHARVVGDGLSTEEMRKTEVRNAREG